MFVIAKSFDFCAAHSLPHLAPGHKCRRQHGHNYRVTLVLASKHLDPDGFVADYDVLGSAKRWMDENLDHRDLNDATPLPTTAESLASHLYHLFATSEPWGHWLHTVVVQETPKTMAAYTPKEIPIVWAAG